MVGETYNTIVLEENTLFYFVSEGDKGKIIKAVMFQFMHPNNYNLAFGDLKQNMKVDDHVISNNNDAPKILATVAKCVYDFLEKYSGSTIHITPVDDRRKMLYNYVFQKRIKEIEERFKVFGKRDEILEPYEAEKYYDEFILDQK